MQEVVPVGLAGASVCKQFVIMLCGQGRLLSSVSTCPVASNHNRHWTSFRKAIFDSSGGFGPPGKYLQRDFDLSCYQQHSKASRYQHLPRPGQPSPAQPKESSEVKVKSK